MISFDEAIVIHSILIEKHGGLDGLRDNKLLKSALARPFQTFNKTDLYPKVTEKAAAIIESILINHPFIDGNKRFGYVAMRLTLMKFGQDLTANQDDKYAFVIKIAEGKMKIKEISKWIEEHLV